MVKTTLFVYGSLMNPQVLASLLEASSYRLLGEADLIGYHRTGIKGVNYPAIHPALDDAHVVKGMLLRLTTQKAIETIDYFEDSVSEHPEYLRTDVTPRIRHQLGSLAEERAVGAGNHGNCVEEGDDRVYAYVWNGGQQRLTGTEWSYEAFVEKHLKTFLKNSCGVE